MPLESLYSNQVTAMAGDALGPAKVLNVLHSLTQGSVTLSWDAVTTNSDGSAITDLSGYRVFRKKDAIDPFLEIGSVPSNELEYTDSTAKDGASYIYAIAAFDDETTPQEGPKSDNVVLATIPSIPQNLVSTAADSLVTLNWDSVLDELDEQVNENLEGYNVYRSETDGSGYVKLGGTASDVTTFEDSTVVNNTTYYYVVTAYDNSL